MNVPYSIADRLFVGPERENVQLSRALTEIPYLTGRRGGSHSLSDWAYSIGVFHTVLRYTLGERDKIDLLDVGCGTGRLALASKLLLGQDGRYVGVDVNAAEIEQCQRQYSDSRFKFIHLPHKNRVYASDQAPTFEPYPLDDNSFDVVTALSVWTHLNEADATFYFREIARVLRPGGKAIVTFFLLDKRYHAFRQTSPASESAFTFRRPDRYDFDRSVDGSDAWLYPAWAAQPEEAIGVTPAGIQRLEARSGLRLADVKHGYWTEQVGLHFQDILVFEKPAAG
jgi:SAM-dependent methyltransferase